MTTSALGARWCMCVRPLHHSSEFFMTIQAQFRAFFEHRTRLLRVCVLMTDVAIARFEWCVAYANARATRANELIGRFGLHHAGAQFPPTLSGGERQRAAIARAIVNRPRLLLADEPTGSLDSESGAVIMDHLCGLNRELGCTLVIITHDPAVAALAHRRITLHDGRVTEKPTVSAK